MALRVSQEIKVPSNRIMHFTPFSSEESTRSLAFQISSPFCFGAQALREREEPPDKSKQELSLHS